MPDRFAIVADSTCDLGRQTREQYDISYVPMNYVIDEQEYPASLDWEYHAPKAFYDLMRNGTRIRTTQVPREVYVQHFTDLLRQGLDVLYLSCSSALSGSINVAHLVANELKAQFPDRTIRCVDPLNSSLGQGALAIRASELRAAGKSLAQTADAITAIRLTMNQFATVDSLEYLRRVGRVKASSAFFGNLFGVKPILISDALGQNFAVKKVKGAANARRELADMIAASVQEPASQCLYLSHADAEDAALRLRDEILARVPFRDTYISVIGPIVGASVGPGTVAAYCYANEVTVNAPEKEAAQ